jgi:hypothetical protein
MSGAVQREEAIPPGEAPGLGLLDPRIRHLLALEFGSQSQFDDPRLEWRRVPLLQGYWSRARR